MFADTGDGEYNDEIGMDSDNDYGTKDFLYDPKFPIKKAKISKMLKVPKVQKGKKKSGGKVGRPKKNVGGRPRKKSIDEKVELVKTQCGRHKIPKMAMMLDIPQKSLHSRIKEEGITFSKKLAECVFCDMEKNMVHIKKDELLSFLRFNRDEDKFECSICNVLLKDRPQMYNHLKEKHRNEINANAVPDTQLENNQDCDGTICAKVYGNQGKKFWCKICKLPLQLAEDARKEPKVCPECGKSVHNLSGHRIKHYQEKHRCSFCSSVFRSLSYLDTHKKAVHEKVPCTECGKLFGIKVMKRHIEAAHTPDDQKKCRCDVCGKGFSCNQRLSEHLNIHTEEKPFKCRYCSASFASRGTCAGHERGHNGRGRKIQKSKNDMIYD